MRTISSFTIDILTIMEQWEITYDTLDEARMTNSNKEQKKKELEEKKELKKMKNDGFL